MNDTRNYILAIALSLVVLIGWQMFIAGPQLERAQRQAELAQQDAAAQGEAQPDLPVPGVLPSGEAAVAPAAPGTPAGATGTRAERIAASARVPIDTPSLLGSINLKGGRLDDLRLKNYRETLEPDSAIITLFSPSGAPHPYYAEQGWRAPAGSSVRTPDTETVWQVEGAGTLTPDQPVTLRWDNGEGLVFRQAYAVDADYLFTVTQTIENTGGGGDVSLHPYSLVSRHETPNRPVPNALEMASFAANRTASSGTRPPQSDSSFDV